LKILYFITTLSLVARGGSSRKFLLSGGGAGHLKVSTVERQKIQLCNNSRTSCIAEPKQNLHEENTAAQS